MHINKTNGTMSPNLLIAAGAQAAAQGLVRSALLTKLLPFAGAASLILGLFGRKGGTEIRPAAGNPNPERARRGAGRSRGASTQLAARMRRRGGPKVIGAMRSNRRVSP